MTVINVLTEKAIEVNGLTKMFGSEVAVKDLDFDLEEGEVLGFVGPNGAGKSTTINAMLGFIQPSEGSIKIFGMDINENPRTVKSRIGVVPEDYELYPDRTGVEHIEMSARAKREEVDPQEVVEKVGLTQDQSKRKISGYSTGMKQRLILGMALIGDPDLLILDEPGNGLDPNGIRRLQEIINKESNKGVSVFFSSHILSNIENVCDKIVVLNEGQSEFSGSIDELRKEVGQRKEMTVTYKGENKEDIGIESLNGVIECNTYDNGEIKIVYERQISVENILRKIMDKNIEIDGIKTDEESLSELFGQITTNEEDDITGDIE
jgi:ABC-2 type transport system ATP-binding protein